MAEKELPKEDVQDRPGVSADAPQATKAAKKAANRADLAKLINEDVSLSPLRTFERDQLVEKISVLLDLK